MAEVTGKTHDAGTGLEPGEHDLVQRDGRQPGQRNVERGMVKERDAEQRQSEEDEIDRDATDGRHAVGGKSGNRQQQECGQ